MASKENLIIHSLIFEIEVDSKDDYKHFADRISYLSKNDLPSKLQASLDKYDLPSGNLIINKLEIDLGNISPNLFENTIIEAIVYELEIFLSNNIRKIKQEISQAQFKATLGGKYEVQKSEFTFRSELTIEQSTELSKEIEIADKEQINLETAINSKSKIFKEQKISKKLISEIYLEKLVHSVKPNLQYQINLILAPKIGKQIELIVPETPKEKPKLDIEKVKIKNKPQEIVLLQKATGADESPIAQQKLKVKQKKLAKPQKILTSLDKAFIYYLKYGRLPSNVKYELGNSMLDVFYINHQDEAFFDELNYQIQSNDRAKERLVRLLDQSKAVSEFDPKVPISFEDYFTALIHGLQINLFDAGIKRYNLNDMIRFLYADNPNKLKNLIKYLMVDYSSDLEWPALVDNLFEKISKPSIVKLISSFAKKGANLNRSLNEVNRKSGEDSKSAHKKLFKLLISNGDTSSFDFEIRPRRYAGASPDYQKGEFDNSKLINYYLTNGSLPYSQGLKTTIENLNSSILTLSSSQISALAFFKNKKALNYEIVGNLSVKAISHLIKALSQDLQDGISSSYLFFKNNIEAGVSEKFQRAFMLYHALDDDRKSYLEGMIKYWKEQFGDSDDVLKQRWKVKEELGKELNILLATNTKTVKDEIKVDYTYNNYANDISVKNAGLVILWPFLKVYFNMLELLNSEGNFRSMKERARACHLLQYLAIKRSYGEEFYYPLNKILTGYPLEEPLPYEITMTKKEIDVSNALLNNVLKQWNALKGGSVEGLRGSFLIRDGILTASPNGWLLTVEHKAYDILMDKMPWGIGMIKLSWAPYVLNVDWERNTM